MKNQFALAVVAGALLTTACDRAPSEAPPALAHVSMASAAEAAVTADRALIRKIVRETADDARKHAPQWFGDRKTRTTAATCEGITRLIAKHMATFDDAKQRPRSPEQRRAAAARVVQSVGCGRPRPMSMYRHPLLLASMAPVAMPDSTDEWLAANWHPDTWAAAAQSYMDNGPGPVEPYLSGLTEFEVAQMQTMYCSQSYTVEELGGVEEEEDGEDPMMMYFWPAWAKAALIGCGSNMILNIPAIAEGVHLGAALGGPVTAAAVGVGVALEECLYGAIAGYYVWKLT
jgi:hypothetical protein